MFSSITIFAMPHSCGTKLFPRDATLEIVILSKIMESNAQILKVVLYHYVKRLVGMEYLVVKRYVTFVIEEIC